MRYARFLPISSHRIIAAAHRSHRWTQMTAHSIAGLPADHADDPLQRRNGAVTSQWRVGDARIDGLLTSWWPFPGRKVTEGQAGSLPHNHRNLRFYKNREHQLFR